MRRGLHLPKLSKRGIAAALLCVAPATPGAAEPVLREYAVPAGSHPHDVAPPAPDGEGHGPAMRECLALSYEAPCFSVAAARRSATHAFRLLPALWAAVLIER